MTLSQLQEPSRQLCIFHRHDFAEAIDPLGATRRDDRWPATSPGFAFPRNLREGSDDAGSVRGLTRRVRCERRARALDPIRQYGSRGRRQRRARDPAAGERAPAEAAETHRRRGSAGARNTNRLVRPVPGAGGRPFLATGEGAVLRGTVRGTQGCLRNSVGEHALREIGLDAGGRGRLAQGRRSRRQPLPTADLGGRGRAPDRGRPHRPVSDAAGRPDLLARRRLRRTIGHVGCPRLSQGSSRTRRSGRGGSVPIRGRRPRVDLLHRPGARRCGTSDRHGTGAGGDRAPRTHGSPVLRPSFPRRRTCCWEAAPAT